MIKVLAILAVCAGAVFTLQGVGVLGGSFMSGSAAWAIIGVALVILGVTLYARSTRTR